MALIKRCVMEILITLAIMAALSLVIAVVYHIYEIFTG
ncbi:hypothetical protein BrE312_1894 [Brenneria sp. EniD312]|nr:hypothetical protein BrE312_1894 [Brenneria sp. EniD312]